MALFTVDWEDWNDALHIEKGNHSSETAWWWLIFTLQDYEIKGVFYGLEYLRESPQHETFRKCLATAGHRLMTHGVWHYWWENADRRPYQWLGLTGGFWFRILPLWFIKRQVKKHGMFYIHPHDLDEQHPKIKNPLLNWKRHVGLKTARAKLKRLLSEIKWSNPWQ